ncbi:TPA: AAA family ATPase [Vibrio vulnificus]|nr:AAA family ATPase [Vibrio vulnificus]HDY8167881.1 AAA family ATPase [Vibrio vulnificus]
MLNAIEIENFKSTSQLELSLGRFNVFIGANGSGKSTILEALAFAIASENDNLNTELLEIRGIRITEPALMRSSFKKTNTDPIVVKLYVGETQVARQYKVNNSNEEFSDWKVIKDTIIKDADAEEEVDSDLIEDGNILSLNNYRQMSYILESLNSMLHSETFKIFAKDEEFKKNVEDIYKLANSSELKETKKIFDEMEINVNKALVPLSEFAIYSPEYRELRNPYKEGALKPLGINGEGLLKLFRHICLEQKDAIEDIEECLDLIDWFGAIELPRELDDDLSIEDRFLPVKINQRSTNEGFLYVLFYSCLVVSDKTPKIFAIDNIDAALNPALCKELVRIICKLSKKYDKQIFITAHNPAVLDGLDLDDEEQALFVVSRSKRNGQTKVTRINSENKPKVKAAHKKGETIPLSEAMLRGYIPNALSDGF